MDTRFMIPTVSAGLARIFDSNISLQVSSYNNDSGIIITLHPHDIVYIERSSLDFATIVRKVKSHGVPDYLIAYNIFANSEIINDIISYKYTHRI